jgi:hypothetical protein
MIYSGNEDTDIAIEVYRKHQIQIDILNSTIHLTFLSFEQELINNIEYEEIIKQKEIKKSTHKQQSIF